MTLPYLTARPPAFVFLTSLRDDADLYRIGASAFLRRYSRDEADFRRKMCSLPPLVAGEVVFGFSPLRGEVIVVMRMPGDLLGPGGERVILAGLELAVQRKAGVIGLGALVSPATAGGRRLLRHLPAGVTVTNGNAYTAAVVARNVAEAAGGSPARVAVVGCTGSVGVAASRLLSDAGHDLVLVGRSPERVRARLGDLLGRSAAVGDAGSLRAADVVVLLTSDDSARLAPAQVSPGAVVIDFAHPANVARDRVAAFEARGVTVAEGGIVRIPGFAATVDFGMPGPGDTAACLAETWLFARRGLREHSLGHPTAEAARRYDDACTRLGVAARPLDLTPRTVAGEGRRVPV